MPRRDAPWSDKEAAVRDIIDDVHAHGDDAVLKYARQFDCPTLTKAQLRVQPKEVEAACREVGRDVLRAMERIAANIRDYHERQQRQSWLHLGNDGVVLGQKFTAIENVGIYAPSGLASTVLMIAVPAHVAGVKRLVLSSPPRRDGSLSPPLLAAAKVAAVDEIYRLGSAWALAALAFGTETVKRVDKIVGPGNVYVVLAKKLLFGAVGIESLPGPSEVVVIADETARPAWVAADLLAQAEHGPDSLCGLVTNSAKIARATARALAEQLKTAPRAALMRQSLDNFGFMITVDSLDEACELVNLCAPEHVQLCVREPLRYLAQVRHAGAIFLGHDSPVPVGDYVAGPSHVLPTAGTARFASGLSVDDFIKKTSIIGYTAERLQAVAPDVDTIAAAEELPAHAAAVRMRL
ncbi:MAG: histidinol dehydrogenase [Abditibacteriales bacterium]|nr:histidinol dehydrogenase [Abditibacteriales bacterium]